MISRYYFYESLLSVAVFLTTDSLILMKRALCFSTMSCGS